MGLLLTSSRARGKASDDSWAEHWSMNIAGCQ